MLSVFGWSYLTGPLPNWPFELRQCDRPSTLSCCNYFPWFIISEEKKNQCVYVKGLKTLTEVKYLSGVCKKLTFS